MDSYNWTSICRICLKDGATLPIFENNETNQENIITKISVCMNVKMVKIDGLPNQICRLCDETLNSFYTFISKFRETCKILEEKLLTCSLDKNDNYYSDQKASDEEIDVKDIKLEHDYNSEVVVSNIIEPLKLKLPDIKIEKVLKSEDDSIKTVVMSKKQLKNKSSKIATSILEAELIWTGNKWCLKSKCSAAKVKKKVFVTRVREKKLDLPKVTADESSLCDICGEVFPNRDKLLVHKKNIHLKQPVQCTICSRVCASTYYLNRHMKRKHETERNFICTICGKGFVFRGELSSHTKNVHHKDKIPKRTFACKFCDKTYKCPKSIVVHERSVHTGLRPAVCSVCGSSFYHIDYLKEHMRLHTGETPFKCPVCGRGYAQRCNMKSHLRIHRVSELDAATLSKLRPNYLKLLKA